MEKIGVAYWRAKAADLADKAQDNHGISAQKFHLLREFLSLGYRVLLSGAAGAPKGEPRVSVLTLPCDADVDIVTLQNPFNFLVRDSDVEGLSDGFDERTAYGACLSSVRGSMRAVLKSGWQVTSTASMTREWVGLATPRQSASLCSTLGCFTSSQASARCDSRGRARRRGELCIELMRLIRS